ncbi:MAG: nitroreductase [Prevotellaceae bacterium]|jgi:nitroreductase|nr:nitroreductase [Prevotellaceae bacterium]
MKKLFISAVALTTIFASCCQKPENQFLSQKNETMESILNRRSIRAYTAEPVSDGALDTIINAAVNAPSARNLQPWQVRVIKNRSLISAIEEGVAAQKKAENPNLEPRSFFFGAPVLIVVAYDKSNDKFGKLDCGWLGQNILLSAQSLGLGACVVANGNDFFNSEAARKIIEKLQFPDGYEVIYSIALGHPNESPDAKPRDKSKVLIIE